MLKFLLFVAIFLYFFPKVLRFGLKMFIGNQMEKVQKDFQNQTRQSTRKEGEIKVETPQQKAKTKDMGGEYIDYEEVKD